MFARLQKLRRCWVSYARRQASGWLLRKHQIGHLALNNQQLNTTRLRLANHQRFPSFSHGDQTPGGAGGRRGRPLRRLAHLRDGTLSCTPPLLCRDGIASAPGLPASDFSHREVRPGKAPGSTIWKRLVD
jgi:hypothetical protein